MKIRTAEEHSDYSKARKIAKRGRFLRMLRTYQDVVAVMDGCYYDPEAAQRVINFAHFFKHVDGPHVGQQFRLLAWQQDELIRPLFGWKRADGTRRFRRAYISIPKKNGKSTLCGIFVLYLLVADREARPEVYGAAIDRKQASIVFRAAKDLAEKSRLSKMLKIIPSTKRIIHKDGFYEVLSADAVRAEGFNIHGLVIDELHAQRTRKLWDALIYGGAARQQPLFISITTAGYDRNSICWEEHQLATQILEGTIEDPYKFGLIYSADKDDDWGDRKVWHKCNPSMRAGVISEIDFREHYLDARTSPTKENAFRRYRLNQWTEQATRWISMEAWDACGGYPDLAELDGATCHGGLDLSSTTDITALIFAFKYDDKYVIVPRFYVPAENMRKREDTDHVPYATWAKQGYIIATPGNVVDQDFIREDIKRLGEQYHIKRLAIDRWNAAQITTQLGADGLDVMPFGQGFGSMNEPTKRLERLILSKQIMHGGNPVLRWMAGNVSVEQDAAGNLKPSKAKSTERIDGIVACIMALGSAGMEPEDTESVYETMGAIVI